MIVQNVPEPTSSVEDHAANIEQKVQVLVRAAAEALAADDVAMAAGLFDRASVLLASAADDLMLHCLRQGDSIRRVAQGFGVPHQTIASRLDSLRRGRSRRRSRAFWEGAPEPRR